jgi:hypothetical protein
MININYLVSRMRSRPKQLRKIVPKPHFVLDNLKFQLGRGAHYRNWASVQVWRVAVAICILSLGSDFLLVMVGLFDQSWLSLCISCGWLLVCLQNHSLSRLRCSGVASAYGWVTILLYCPWLNEHIHYFLTGYGPTLSLDSLTAGR